MADSTRTPILVGRSGASVFRVRGDDGREWIEKSGRPDDTAYEAAVLRWCRGQLPVAEVLTEQPGLLTVSALPGVDLTHLPNDTAVSLLVEALAMIHALPPHACPFDATWSNRLKQGAQRVTLGLVDESDFDEDNAGRTAADVLAELVALPSPPPVMCFTHGDACLPNFMGEDRRLTGIVDVGRAGLSHPAQDWALALRSMRDNRGPAAETLLRRHVPPQCQDEALLRQFRLLDELF